MRIGTRNVTSLYRTGAVTLVARELYSESMNLEPTTVQQVVACAFVAQRARVRSPVGTSLLDEVFLGVFPHL